MEVSRLDIMLLTDNSIDTVGGEQESTKIILNEIKRNRKVGLIQPGKVKKHVGNIKYYEISDENRIKHLVTNPFKFLGYILNVRNAINESNPKVLHSQSQVSFFIISLLKKLHLISSEIFLIHTERGLYSKYNSFFKRIFIYFMSELSVLITTTKYNNDLWENALKNKNYSLQTYIIENTAGELFESIDKSLLDRSDESFTIGFSGRYASWKNWPLAITICEKMNELIGDSLKVKMTVGCLDEKAEFETKKMFSYLDDIFQERFEGKINVSIEEMDLFYYGLDVFILTSQKNSESFGRTLVEAMSRMTAVLTTDAGGSVEVVGDESKVITSVDDAIKKLVKLYEEPDILETEKINNLKRVHQHYSLNNNLVKHGNLYAKFITE